MLKHEIYCYRMTCNSLITNHESYYENLLLRDNRCKTSHPHDLSMLNTVHITSHKLLSNSVETIQTAGREIVS